MIPAEAIARQGWRAALALRYERVDDRTVLTRREHDGPLRMQKALYPEAAHTCHGIVVHPPGGIAGGDTLDLDLDLTHGARALLTTPGATKWYRAERASARQALHIELAPDTILEWLPQENIVFNAARAEVSTSVQLRGNALYIGWDMLCFGRTASGERFDHGQVRSTIEIWRDGKRLWNEYLRVCGDDPAFAAAAGCAGHATCATMLAAGRDIDKNLLSKLRAIETSPGMLAGITALPGLLVARCLAPFAQHARAYFVALWALLRPALTARAAVMPRIWST